MHACALAKVWNLAMCKDTHLEKRFTNNEAPVVALGACERHEPWEWCRSKVSMYNEGSSEVNEEGAVITHQRIT